MPSPTAVNDHLYVSAEQYAASLNLFANDGPDAGSYVYIFDGLGFGESASGSFYIREEDGAPVEWTLDGYGNFTFDSYLDENVDYEAPREIVDVSLTYNSWDGRDDNLISNQAVVTIHIAYWAQDLIESDAAVVYGDKGYNLGERGPTVSSIEPMIAPTVETNDVIVGTSDEGQKLYGLDGDDFIIGGEGDDTIVGGDGFDIIWAGGGNDRIDLSDGDEVDGGDGIDTGYGMTWDGVGLVDLNAMNLEFVEVQGQLEYSFTNQGTAYAEALFTSDWELVTLDEYFYGDGGDLNLYMYTFGDAGVPSKTIHEVWDGEVLVSSTTTDNGNDEIWQTWYEEYFSNGTLKEFEVVYDDGSSKVQRFYNTGELYQTITTDADGDILNTYFQGEESVLFYEWTDVSNSEDWTSRTVYYDEFGSVANDSTEWDNGTYVRKSFTDGVITQKFTSNDAMPEGWLFEVKNFDENGDLSDVTHYDSDEDRIDSFQIDTLDEFAWKSIESHYNEDGVIVDKTILWDGGVLEDNFYLSGALVMRESTDLNGSKPWHTKLQYFGPEELLMETELYRANGSLKQDMLYDRLNQYNWDFKSTRYTKGGDIKAQEFMFDNGLHIYSSFENGVKSESVAYDEGDQFEWATRIRVFDGDGDLIEETFIPDESLLA